MAFIYNLVDTWNNGATTFTAIKMNVTDTASSASSLLMDLQVGGVSQLSVSKAGTAVAGTFQGGLIPSLNTAIYSDASGSFVIKTGSNADNFRFFGSGFVARSTMTIGFAAGTPYNSTADTILARDAANTLAQRNGVNAQTSRIYNTYTDASNYERGFTRWNTNVFEIGAEAAGTGTQRGLQVNLFGATARIFNSSAGSNIIFSAGGNTLVAIRGADISLGLGATQPLVWTTVAGAPAGTADTGLIRSAAGVVVVTNASTGGGALEFREQTAPAAPATNSVRIYAEDDGAGKTRLMARFATGAAVQIAIEP
jgi:hypothetical protein